MDLLASIQFQALRDVYLYGKGKESDPEYTLRKMFRWYSKTFHTPLHIVETLPFTDVLQAWWEEKYEEMTPEDLEHEREEILRTPEELEEAQRVEDAADADTWEMIQEERKAEAAVAKKLDKLKLPPEAAPFFSSIQREPELIMAKIPQRETPPEIKMVFVDDLELEADSFGLLDRPGTKP